MSYKIDASLGALNTSQVVSQLVRTSTGNLYTVIITSGDVRVYLSVNNGLSWTAQDYANVPPTAGTICSVAIDSIDTLHIIYTFPTTTVRYVRFSTSTNTFGISEKALTSGGAFGSIAIAVDSNNIPHIVGAPGGNSLLYTNRLPGYWPAGITADNNAHTAVDLLIDVNNVPQISAVETTNTLLRVIIGNKNNASAFTGFTLAATTAFTSAGNTSLAIDILGNTWFAYQAAQNGPIQLAKHVKTDAWSTWQIAVTNGYSGKSLSLAADPSNIYVFYERNAGGLAYDRYDIINRVWLGEQVIQANTPRSTTNIQYHNPFVKWSQYFNNGDTAANNASQQNIEYLFDDGSTVYYDKLVTAQISTGFVNATFSATQAGTTTSTSSTSSSTSISTSTSSTSSSTSISISTSSTSISTSSTSSSTSTSSTSSSISTSSTSSSTSTSQSTSTSSTSSSTSRSTSTSSTSSSISTSSTSSSISTSSTSSSISTSSTSSSTSTSLSTSSTSSSTSTSFSTSSTSSSISTSSTSSSTSTSSTSSSTSRSTSTSSTSQSTSTTQSFTTSTSSTSSSISTSSTSSSTSVSTSSTSQSTSTSSTSTSRSTSTSSTSTSTTQSTSTSSTSTSKSTSTSSTSRSTSSSTSVSSTSSSTSTTVSITTSTSSTSSSTSTSTTLPPDIRTKGRGAIIIRASRQNIRIEIGRIRQRRFR